MVYRAGHQGLNNLTITAGLAMCADFNTAAVTRVSVDASVNAIYAMLCPDIHTCQHPEAE